MLISTTVDNSAFDGNDEVEDFDIATPAASRDFILAQASTGTPNIDQDSDGMAFAPDGTEILGQEAFAATSLPADGPGVCRFGGMFFVD